MDNKAHIIYYLYKTNRELSQTERIKDEKKMATIFIDIACHIYKQKDCFIL